MINFDTKLGGVSFSIRTSKQKTKKKTTGILCNFEIKKRDYV